MRSNEWTKVVLTAKSLADGSSVSINIINRPPVADTAGTYFLSVLLDVPNISNKLGNHVPAASRGQIICIDDRGSAGANRRLSDFLDGYDVSEQIALIYIAETESGDLDPAADFELVGSVTVENFELKRTPRGDQIVFDVTSDPLPTRSACKIVDSTQSAFTSTEAESMGRAIPLILGASREVKPVKISASGVDPTYAYGTTFGTQYVNGGVQSILARNSKGKFVSLGSSSISTIYNGLAFDGSEVDLGVAIDAALITTRGEEFAGHWFTESSGRVYTQGFFGFKFLNATVNGIMGFRFYEINRVTPLPGVAQCVELLGTGTADLNDWDGGIGFRYVRWAWNKPIVTEAGKFYALVAVAPSAGYTNLNGALGSGSQECYSQGKQPGTSLNLVSGNQISGYCGLYAASFTDTATPVAADVNALGLGHSKFEMTQRAAESPFNNPVLDSLDPIVVANGIKDDTSGTITGSAGTLLQQPDHVFQVLLMSYSGSSWGNSKFNTSQFSTQRSTAFGSTTSGAYRRVAGAVVQAKSLAVVLQQICQELGLFLVRVPDSTQEIGLFPWGLTESTFQIDGQNVVLTDENSALVGLRSTDASRIVNSVLIAYDRSFSRALLGTNYAFLAGRSGWDYASALFCDSATDPTYATISKSIYGARELQIETCDFIADAVTALTRKKFIFSNYALAPRYATFDILDRYLSRSLRLCKVVEILTPQLPAFYGTTPNFPPILGTNGEQIELTPGVRMVQAKRYRALIEQIDLNLSVNKGGQAFSRIVVRLLENSADPT